MEYTYMCLFYVMAPQDQMLAKVWSFNTEENKP